MNKYIEMIAAPLLTVVGSFVVSTMASILYQDDFRIYSGTVVEVAGRSYVTVEFEVIAKNAVNGLIFTVPKDTVFQEIQSSSPILIKSVEGGVSARSEKLVEFNQILPRRRTQVLIPFKDVVSSGSIMPINYKQKNGSFFPAGTVRDVVEDAVYSSLIAAIAGVVIIFPFIIYFSNKLNSLGEKLKETKELRDEEGRKLLNIHENLKKDAEDLRERLQIVKNQAAKTNVLLHARISDYARELDFWRNTIKSLVVKGGGDMRSSEKIIETITEKLGTYQTSSKSRFNFDYIKVAAEILGTANREVENSTR